MQKRMLMKKIIILVLVSIVPISSYSQRTKLKKVPYHNSKVIKEEYYVLRKNKYAKHGSYKSYFEDGTIKEIGTYRYTKKNGEWKEFNHHGELKRICVYKSGKLVTEKRTGIWLETHEHGQVVTGYDYDKDEEIETKFEVQISYPRVAREKGVSGVVKIHLKLTENCDIEEVRVVKSLGYGCDEEVIRGYTKLVGFWKQYAKDQCKEFDAELVVNFRLN